MRLYLTPHGAWHGTQDDASRACIVEGSSRQAWVPIDIPTDKPGLLSWLNNYGAAFALPAEPGPPTPPPAPAAPTANPTQTALQRDITVEEAIAAADYPRALRLAEHVHCRLMEHARGAA